MKSDNRLLRNSAIKTKAKTKMAAHIFYHVFFIYLLLIINKVFMLYKLKEKKNVKNIILYLLIL
jgi:hypothetical protein